jgi:hypothetical protein
MSLLFPRAPASRPRTTRRRVTTGWPLSARIGWHTGPRQPSGCRDWTGAKTGDGYAALRIGKATLVVSRLILGLPLGDPRIAMHSCDRPICVEPTHLSKATHAQNQLDAARKGRNSNSRKTHCANGHPFNADNTHQTTLGRRSCRACGRHYAARKLARRR